MISVSHRVVVHETEPGVCLTTASGLSIETASREHPLIAGLLLAVAALVVGMPLFAGQVLGGHDIVVYLINAQQMAENQREGELFPAWAGGFNAGYGSPTLLFFPPLTSYLHATAIHLGIPVIAGVCIWSMVGLFFSGAAMFGWLRSIGSCPSALAGALVYMVAPYRVINLYHRSALAEHWAFVWPPLILWAATTSRMPPAVRVPLVAFSVVALLLSNIPLALLFGVGLATWFVLSTDLRGRRLEVAGGAALGFVMAAFALVPQALSSSLLAVDHIYGASAGRFRPSANTLFSHGLDTWNFNAQVSTIVVATFVIILLAYLLTPGETRLRIGIRATVIGATLCVIFTLGHAGLLWEAIPLFSKLQFPWRVASLLTFAVALMVATLDRRRGWILATLVAAVSLVFSPWTRTVPISAFLAEEPPPIPAGQVFPDPHDAWEAGGGGWYWRHENLAEIWFLAANVRPFLLSDLAGNRAPQLDAIRDRPAVLMEDQTTPVRVRFWGSIRREVEVHSSVSGTLLWRVIRFPEMTVTIDNRPVEIFTDPTTGLLAHLIPAGEHVVRWKWGAFTALSWARRASLAGFLLSIGILLAAVVRLRTASRSAPGV